MAIGSTMLYTNNHRLEFWREGNEFWTPVHNRDYEIGPGYCEMIGKVKFFPVPYKMAKGCFDNL